ncbi:putative RNA polymerase beta subunit [Erwinia phage vB_EamM_Special G]|uniref:Putative RNA polymerase beta subunit n=1 Tax=Erwinia phage vB_EamM_Special G TaxID=1815989 RepID=A0A191ZC57_9CAUD|nr:RNA polymerase beta subunit [Erwinia phage vB_EamM_Special G]ANJ64976.1 putative RNA polymerase beta subunit [Erwinia phage vB_EamM_Special G]
MILYNAFFRRTVVRKKEQVFGPRFLQLSQFELPRGSLLHYIPTDLTEQGIENNDLLINRYSDDIYIDHVPQIQTPLGNPQRKPISLMPAIKRYHNTHRRFKLVRNINSVIRNKLYMIVENYAIAQHQLVYRPAMYSNYYRWYNMQYTVMHNMTRLQGESDRNQFVYLPIPASLPQLAQLKIYEERLSAGLDKVSNGTGLENFDDLSAEARIGYAMEAMLEYQDTADLSQPMARDQAMAFQTLVMNATNDTVNLAQRIPGYYNGDAGSVLRVGMEALGAYASKVMNFTPQLSMAVMNRLRTPADYWFIHFWMWLGNQREASLFSMLDHDKLDKIHLVLGNVGAYSVIRLDILDQWRTEILSKTSNPETAVQNFRKHILKFLTRLFDVKNGNELVIEHLDDGADAHEVGEEGQEIAPEQSSVVPPTADTGLFGTELPALDDPAPVVASSTKKGTSKGKDIGSALNDEEPIDAVDLYETRTLADDIDDDEFNHDTESRRGEAAAYTDTSTNPEDGVLLYLERLSDAGVLTVAEYKRFQQLAVAYKNIPNPVGEGTLADLMIIDPSKVTDLGGLDAPDSISIIDKGLLKSSTKDFDKNYIKNLMEADILNAVLSIQNSGVAIIDYQREEKKDARNSYVVYSVQVQPVGGKVTTLRFRVPKLNEDGTSVVNGVKSRLRKQRVDIPIRKVSASKVSLTSYYGKLFMERSELSVHNYSEWLSRRIKALAIADTPEITRLVLGRSFDPKVRVPHLYAILASQFKGFQYLDYTFNFNRREMVAVFGEEVIEKYAENRFVVCGMIEDSPLLMDDNGTLYQANNDVLSNLGDFETLIGLDVSKAPIETVVLGVFRQKVPIGVILAYYYGLGAMIEQFNLQVRTANRGERYQLTKDERAILFNDEVLIFNRTDRLGAMLLNGFNSYAKEVSRFSRYDFDRKSVYLNVLSSAGMGVRWLREFDLMREMYIDPITREELLKMNAPVKFDLLLVHGTKMLLNDQHIRETSFREQRVRGAERISGAIYLELVRSMRIQKARATSSKVGLELHPDAVWFDLMQDTSAIPVEECNPIHNIKDMEVITYGGSGGRTSRSMTKPTREYIKDNMGMISEASVDNADVGYTAYMSMDPLMTDLRGNTQAATDDTSPTHIVSTSALLAPAADRDSPNRTNFISIQHSQAMYADGYQTTPYRTGAERMIAHRASKLFAYAAEEDGVITEISAKHLMAQYKDRRVGVELGIRYGNASGTTYVHPIITDMAVGQAFKKGDILCWNRNYFERDFMEPMQCSWKAGAMVRVALMEEEFTFEDSSVISQTTAKRLGTRTAKPIAITVDFTQEVRNLLPVGTQVDPETILCTLEDPVTANLGQFDDESFDSLRILANKNPKAKVTGEIARIEVTYRGSVDDMSESLGLIANRSDRERTKLNRQLGNNEANTGESLTPIRVQGTPLEANQAIIEVYVITPMPTLSGDKGVFANQMKSTFGSIMPDGITTASGKRLDAKFSNKSIANRMVTSPYVMGTTNVLLDTITRKACAMYKRLKG